MSSKAGTRIIGSVKLDDYVPTCPLCIRCHAEILDQSKAQYGRITVKWNNRQVRDFNYAIRDGQVVKTPTITDTVYPSKVTGLCCMDCYLELWNATWRSAPDSNNPQGHLRRAFEHVHSEIVQHNNDDFEASPITKGLYAPHIGKGTGKRRDDYHDFDPDMPHSAGGSTLSKIALDDQQARLTDEHKLTGFERTKRDDLNMKPSRTIVRRGKWKVDPATYPDIARKARTPK